LLVQVFFSNLIQLIKD